MSSSQLPTSPRRQQQKPGTQQKNKPKYEQDTSLRKSHNNNNSNNNNNKKNSVNNNHDNSSDNNSDRNTNESILSSDHNDSGYETHEQHLSDFRENSSGSGDSLGTKGPKKAKTLKTEALGDNKSNHQKSGSSGKTLKRPEKESSDSSGHSGPVEEDDKQELNPGSKERVKTGKVRLKTAKTRRSNIDHNPDGLLTVDGSVGVNGESKSGANSEIGSNTSLRSRGSDSSSVSDKRVSFKEGLVEDSESSKGAELNLKLNRNSNTNNSQKSSQSSSKGPGAQVNGAMTAREPARDSDSNNRSGFFSVREQLDYDDDSRSQRERPLSKFSRDGGNNASLTQSNSFYSRGSDGFGNNKSDEDGTVWQKVSTGSPGKDPYDTVSLGSVRSARLLERQGWSSGADDSGYEATGRKFTRKSGKSNLGSSTTLSSNTDGEDSDDVFNVVLRVRPLNDQEKIRKDKFVVDFPGDGQVAVNNSGTNRNFQFNAVFEPDAEQEDVFESSGIKKLVENSIGGYSCTAFAFGQTGSGKTHTMTGPPAQFHQEGVTPDPSMYGLMQRSFKYLFQLLKKQGQNKTVRASYMEVYNEQVIDLLNNSHKRYLAVRWSKNRGFYVENLFTVECVEIDDLMAVLEEGLRNRQTGSHGLNEFSSRSHSVLTVTIDSETQAEGEDDNLYITKRGKLSFVDLAGSEKVKDTTSTGGPGMVESNSINKSLLVLGNCISHLGDPKRRQGHIPYRDSKLTKLLADSLGGNGITLMIACITPSSSNTTETLNTLRYASRAKKIKTKPTVKMDPREKLIVTLKKEIKVLRNENHYLRQQLDFPAKPKGQLQKENDEKFMKFMKETQQKESGLYEMLQEYMVENETLRAEKMEMQGTKDTTRREQQQLHKENERLAKRVEELERAISEHPSTWALVDHHRRTDGYSHNDLSPRGSPVNVGYFNSQKTVRPTDLPIGGANRKVGSPHGQPKKPPHRLQDHVTRPAPRPIDYVEDGFAPNGYMSPRQTSLTSVKGPGSPRQVDSRKASQISHTDVIRANNEKLKQDLLHLEGEIQQHARIAHTNQQVTKFLR